MDERPSTIPAEDKVIIKLRLRLPVISFLFLLAAALLLPNQVWNTLLIGLGGLFLVGYVWVRQLAKHLHGSRQLRYGWVAVGDRLEERFDLFNDSFIPALWVEIIDYTNIPGYRTAVVRSVSAQSRPSLKKLRRTTWPKEIRIRVERSRTRAANSIRARRLSRRFKIPI